MCVYKTFVNHLNHFQIFMYGIINIASGSDTLFLFSFKVLYIEKSVIILLNCGHIFVDFISSQSKGATDLE